MLRYSEPVRLDILMITPALLLIIFLFTHFLSRNADHRSHEQKQIELHTRPANPDVPPPQSGCPGLEFDDKTNPMKL